MKPRLPRKLKKEVGPQYRNSIIEIRKIWKNSRIKAENSDSSTDRSEQK